MRKHHEQKKSYIKTTLRLLTAEEVNEIMSLHDELNSNHNYELNQVESSSDLLYDKRIKVRTE